MSCPVCNPSSRVISDEMASFLNELVIVIRVNITLLNKVEFQKHKIANESERNDLEFDVQEVYEKLCELLSTMKENNVMLPRRLRSTSPTPIDWEFLLEKFINFKVKKGKTGSVHSEWRSFTWFENELYDRLVKHKNPHVEFFANLCECRKKTLKCVELEDKVHELNELAEEIYLRHEQEVKRFVAPRQFVLIRYPKHCIRPMRFSVKGHTTSRGSHEFSIEKEVHPNIGKKTFFKTKLALESLPVELIAHSRICSLDEIEQLEERCSEALRRYLDEPDLLGGSVVMPAMPATGLKKTSKNDSLVVFYDKTKQKQTRPVSIKSLFTKNFDLLPHLKEKISSDFKGKLPARFFLRKIEMLNVKPVLEPQLVNDSGKDESLSFDGIENKSLVFNDKYQRDEIDDAFYAALIVTNNHREDFRVFYVVGHVTANRRKKLRNYDITSNMTLEEQNYILYNRPLTYARAHGFNVSACIPIMMADRCGQQIENRFLSLLDERFKLDTIKNQGKRGVEFVKFDTEFDLISRVKESINYLNHREELKPVDQRKKIRIFTKFNYLVQSQKM